MHLANTTLVFMLVHCVQRHHIHVSMALASRPFQSVQLSCNVRHDRDFEAVSL
jgi:hypothetical protein